MITKEELGHLIYSICHDPTKDSTQCVIDIMDTFDCFPISASGDLMEAVKTYRSTYTDLDKAVEKIWRCKFPKNSCTSSNDWSFPDPLDFDIKLDLDI